MTIVGNSVANFSTIYGYIAYIQLYGLNMSSNEK